MTLLYTVLPQLSNPELRALRIWEKLLEGFEAASPATA